MRARLKRLHSPDVNLENYWPDDEGCFGFLMQAMIGPEGTSAEESFDFMVATPKWLGERYASSKAIFGRHYLIVFGYDMDLVRTQIERLCASLSAPDWPELAGKLGQYGKWEFEDYVPNA